jgi:hypothetical protein
MSAPQITWKHAAIYLGAGAVTLGWSTSRAGRGLAVWPGLGAKAPGAVTGAAETVLLWPLAAYGNYQLSKKDPATAKPDGVQVQTP